jgi:hypothetical protein
MTRPDKKDLIWVTWKDAVGCSSRVQFESLKDISLVYNTNLGWIIDENSERIVLAHGVSTSGEVDHFAIPTGDIISREPVVAKISRKKKDAA